MDKINSKFDELKETRLEIKQGINKINEIKDSVKKNYTQYIEKEKQNFFGLDSFHFQNKAIELEHTNMLHLYHFIDNRIYGDYYKLFHMIEKSLKSQLNETQLHKMKELYHLKQYPLYKDLEPFKIYDFDLINQIHQDIILVLENVKEIYQENKINIEDHKKHLDLGMNIDNYVINQEYMNHHLHMSNQLHENYLHVFHKYHAEWLKKYHEKIQLFHKQIEHHEDVYEQPSKEVKKEIPKVIKEPPKEEKKEPAKEEKKEPAKEEKKEPPKEEKKEPAKEEKKEPAKEEKKEPPKEEKKEPPKEEEEEQEESVPIPHLKIDISENTMLNTIVEETDEEHLIDLSENTIIDLKNDEFNL